MRWSDLFIPTLREPPSDSQSISQQLLVRAGCVRQLAAGHYSLLPLGMRVREKIIKIIRDEMNAIGGQELLMPTMHPLALWESTGRAHIDVLFKLKDRKAADHVLAVTHEEAAADLAKELRSYKQLPQIWYQIQLKFRDEVRPKGGLLRVREFTMKDSYSFDLGPDGLDESFEKHRQAYKRIFARLGVQATEVEASSGSMGGSESVEFMSPSPSGEDTVVRCPMGDYAANAESGTSTLPAVEVAEGPSAPEGFDTPGVRTIADLERFPNGAPAENQIKTLVYLLDDDPALILLRGDCELMQQKLLDATGASNARPAHPEEIRKLLGANPGSLGAVGVSGVKVYADLALRGRSNMTTGANADDVHVRGVSIERDINVTAWFDVRLVKAGEACPRCGHPLEVFRGLEVGHIFKLGYKYSDAMNLVVQDGDGKSTKIIMGSYGIGIERNMAAIVENSYDDKGIVWPVNVAPFEVVITMVQGNKDEAVRAFAEQLYAQLVASGVDVLLDDREERTGVKLADAELLGFPYRVTIGPKTLAEGAVELHTRRTNNIEKMSVSDARRSVIAKLSEERASAR